MDVNTPTLEPLNGDNACEAAPHSVAEQLATFTCGLSIEKIPAEVRTRAKHLFLDGIGIAIASTGYDFAHRALTGLHELGGQGNCPVIGFRSGMSLRDSALMNGILVHGLDYDDTHSAGVVHPTASLLPTVLAAGAAYGASGSDMLAAYIAGIEAAARIGSVARGAFHLAGFHPTGVVGAFACTLAAGRLMGLTEKQLVMAQGIALSAAAGSLECLEDGAWTKRFHGGWAAASGITAAGLARHGFTGPSLAYEGRFGLYATHLQSRYDADALPLATADLMSRWETMQVAVKPFPACHLVHACADAALALRDRYGITPTGIDRILASIPREAINIICEPTAKKLHPANSYDAQFSLAYVVAAALVRGRFTLDELSEDAIGDPTIRGLAERLDYRVDEKTGFPKYYSGELSITMADGRILSHREHINRGCGERPLEDREIQQKYSDNACRMTTRQRADEIRAAVLELDGLDDLSHFLEALRLA